MRRLMGIFLCFALLCFPVKAAPAGKYVALTFDDGPSGKYTRQLLQGLQERNVRATFLLCGYRIREYPETAMQIFEQGHEIGLHGDSHKSMNAMSQSQIARELQQTLAVLPPGCQPVFFRPPGGQVTGPVQAAAEAADLAILHWSVDPRDWATQNTAAVVQAVVADVADGDVILLHDMTGSSVSAALSIIDTLTEQGFQFVTASELAALRETALLPGNVYHHFR